MAGLKLFNSWLRATNGIHLTNRAREVYIPYDLAYGENGSPPRIPGFAPLQFEVRLLKIKK